MRPESGRRGLSPLLLSDSASGNCLPRPGPPPLLSLQFTPSPFTCGVHSGGVCVAQRGVMWPAATVRYLRMGKHRFGLVKRNELVFLYIDFYVPTTPGSLHHCTQLCFLCQCLGRN